MDIKKAGEKLGLFDFLKGKNIGNQYAIALDIGTEYAKSLIFKVEDGKGIVIGKQHI